MTTLFRELTKAEADYSFYVCASYKDFMKMNQKWRRRRDREILTCLLPSFITLPDPTPLLLYVFTQKQSIDISQITDRRLYTDRLLSKLF